LKKVQRKSRNVTIPAALYERVRQHIVGSSFRSVSEFVTYVVRRVVENGELRGEEK